VRADSAHYPHRSTTYVAKKKRCIDIHLVLSVRSAFVLIESGEGMSTRKLTVEQVLEARLRYAAGERELSKLARAYGVGRQAVQSAAVRHTYKDLPMPPKRIW
jgi:hypothetical protein